MMTKLISTCPSCNHTLTISAMQCPDCGIELNGSFELSVFDKLSPDQYTFLMTFLKCRGNLKDLQSELQISYPTAKKRLEDLLTALDLNDESNITQNTQEVIDVNFWNTDKNSNKASEIIKTKLKENGGRVIIHTISGLPCEICAAPDGKSFTSDKLPIKPPYEYTVFDIIVEHLLKHDGHAKKGNGRNFKLGQEGCDDSTIIGAISKEYSGKKNGDSVFDPVFVLAAVLDWAGIAHNQRGELVLTAAYRGRL